MAYADQQTSGNRITAIVIVALIHVFVGYLFISGLAVSAVKNVVAYVNASKQLINVLAKLFKLLTCSCV